LTQDSSKEGITMGVEPNAKLFEWREPKRGEKAGFGKWKNPRSPYDLFMEAQGIPIHRDIGVHKVQDLPLSPWKRLGGRGIAIQLLGTEHLWGMYVVEVPGAGALNAERHLYEEIYYVIEGRGLAMRRTNIIPDILTCELPPDNRRAFDYRRIEPHMAGANFYMKIAQYKTGQYSKAHKHSSGAILVCIKGKGYSYTWPDRLG